MNYFKFDISFSLKFHKTKQKKNKIKVTQKIEYNLCSEIDKNFKSCCPINGKLWNCHYYSNRIPYL